MSVLSDEFDFYCELLDSGVTVEALNGLGEETIINLNKNRIKKMNIDWFCEIEDHRSEIENLISYYDDYKYQDLFDGEEDVTIWGQKYSPWEIIQDRDRIMFRTGVTEAIDSLIESCEYPESAEMLREYLEHLE